MKLLKIKSNGRNIKQEITSEMMYTLMTLSRSTSILKYQIDLYDNIRLIQVVNCQLVRLPKKLLIFII